MSEDKELRGYVGDAAFTTILGSVAIAGLGLAVVSQGSRAAEPTEPKETPTQLSQEASSLPSQEELAVQLTPREIYGDPQDYQLTAEDLEFRNWLHAKGLSWTDWKGNEHPLVLPKRAFAFARMVERDGGMPWDFLITFGVVETGYSVPGMWWNTQTESYAGAQGWYQILHIDSERSDTWEMNRPYETADPKDPKANTIAANNLQVKIFDGTNIRTISLDEWRERFTGIDQVTGLPTGRFAWNNHPEQADAAYFVYQMLKAAQEEYAALHPKPQ